MVLGALKSKGDKDGAMLEYRKALRLNPNYEPAHRQLGGVLSRKGDLDGACGGRVYTLLATRPERRGVSPTGPWTEQPESCTLRVSDMQLHVPLGSYGVSLIAVGGDNANDAV